MNAVDALKKEKVETRKRISTLRKEVKNEQLQKQALDCEREVVTTKRPSIVEWVIKLFT